MACTCKALQENHPEAWHDATHHPFLDGCAVGTIEPGQFDTWLVQDYLFVIDFTRLAGHLLASAPVRHRSALQGGLTALGEELDWFRDKSVERGVELDAVRQPACAAYADFMNNLRSECYPVQALAFWAIEAAYNQAWRLPGPMKAPYDEYAERWGNPDFSAYVEILGGQADEALAGAGSKEAAAAEAAFSRIAALEKEFWQMAFEGS